MSTFNRNYATLLFLVLFSFIRPADARAWELKLLPSAGETEFKATGRPSALKIVGKGSGPEGSVSVASSKSPGALTGVLEFKLDSLETGIKLRDEHMKKRYLETDKFPVARLTLVSFGGAAELEKSSTAPAKVSRVPFQGTLLLHGVEKPVTGVASVDRSGNDVAAVAEFQLKISDFGIANPGFAGITVAEDVDVSVRFKGSLSP